MPAVGFSLNSFLLYLAGTQLVHLFQAGLETQDCGLVGVKPGSVRPLLVRVAHRCLLVEENRTWF